MKPSQGKAMKKASDKTAKKFLVDPDYLDKLKQIKDRLNDQINSNTTKKISERVAHVACGHGRSVVESRVKI